MDKFLDWFGRNRITIGYVIGGLNVLNGIGTLLIGNFVTAVFWLVLGGAIILDAKYFK